MATAELNLADYPPLDESKFVIQHDVPIFDEHDIDELVRDDSGNPVLGDDGQPLSRKRRYSAEVLAAMAENMNRRIRDTGDYAALVIGHTPDTEQRKAGAEMPPLVGFGGPFFVAPFGDEDPRATIYAKNWAIFRDSNELASKHPRRSVEVWATPDMKDRYFDPIALLGAETPRRDLGLVYSRANPKTPVQRYTACFPSGTNTFIPGGASVGKDDKERRYEFPETLPETQEAPMALSEQDIQQIVAAVSEMAPMKWVESKMLEEQAKVPAEGDPLNPEVATPEAQAEIPAPDAAPPDALAKERNEEPEKKEPEAMADEPKKTEEDKGDEPEKYRKEMATQKVRYAAIENHNKQLTARLNELSGQVKVMTDRATQQERYSKLAELDGQVVFDRETEQARVKDMTAEQFDAHLAIMCEHYEKNPVGMRQVKVPGSVKPVDEKDYTRRFELLVDQYARKGVYKTYEEIEAELAGKLNGQPVS